MSYSIEATEGLEQKITVTIPKEQITTTINKEVVRVSKTARVDGFRKGKIPLDIVRNRFGAGIVQDTLSRLMEETFWQALEEAKVNLAGRPKIIPGEFKDGEDYTFSATFEVYPDVTIENLDKIEVKFPKVEIKDTDIDKMIEILRKQQGKWNDLAEGAEAKAGHRLTLDFKGEIDGETFQGGEANDFVLLTEQNRMIPGFEEGVLGHKLGEEAFVVEATFPEDYHEENLKGKTAKFTITLKRVEELTLPEVDAKFIKSVNNKSKNIEELRTEIRANLERECKNMVQDYEKTQVINGLLAQYESLALPESAVEQEIDALINQSLKQFGAKSLPKDFQMPRDIFKEEAARRVKVGVLLAKIIEENKITATNDEVVAKIADLSKAYEEPEDFVKHYTADNKLMQQIGELVIEENSVNFIKSKAQHVDQEMSFDDLAASIRR